MNIYSDLPKIVYILAIDDCGEGGSASCPHCGAIGRYIYWFSCDDGSQRGAMAGCFKKFPQTKFVGIHKSIIEKERQYKSKGWNLASWDVAILDAIKGFGDGNLSESQAWEIVRREQSRKSAYVSRKYGRRR